MLGLKLNHVSKRGPWSGWRFYEMTILFEKGIFYIIGNRRNYVRNMYKSVVSTMPVDGLAPLGARQPSTIRC